MENTIDTIFSNPVYIAIAGVLAILLVYAIIKKIIKLVFTIGVFLVFYVAYLNYTDQEVPQNLEELAIQNQTGLVMLKIIEIIGEDKVRDLDPETIYFLNSILNKLNLKKIRNSILSEVLPVRV